MVSGCALIVDYILTITVSIAGGGDALFSLLPYSLHYWKLPVEFGAILFLIIMNLRGVKESVTVLVPVFLTFVVTHLFLILGGIFVHLPQVPEVASEVHQGFQLGLAQLGGWGLSPQLVVEYLSSESPSSPRFTWHGAPRLNYSRPIESRRSKCFHGFVRIVDANLAGRS